VPLGPDALRTFAVGQVPADFRFVIVGDSGDERLLLLDLGTRQVTLAAQFQGVGAFPRARQVEIAGTSSGEIFVILLRGDDADARILLIRPVTGDLRAITIPRSEQPRISPDGASLAVARSSDDDSQRGLWIVDLASGSQRRVVADAAGRKATRPLQWSGDGRWLAAVADPDTADAKVALVEPATGGIQTLGAGTGARWRAAELLFWSGRAPGAVTVYDTLSFSARPAYPPEPDITVDRLEPRPKSTDTAVLERGAAGAPRIVLHGTQRAAAVLAQEASDVIGFWWSADGAHLYVWTNDNGTTAVVDALTRTTVVSFCLRQKIAPPCS
jgi:hypothetical protein